MDSLFGIFKSNNPKKQEEGRQSVIVGKSTKKSKGLPMNPASIFSYDHSNPFESSSKEENKNGFSSPSLSKKNSGGKFHNSAGKDQKKANSILPK